MMKETMDTISQKVFGGWRPSMEEALELSRTAPLDEICAAADSIRTHFLSNRVDTCSIMNARSGRCSENCKWCAQSAFNKTGCEVYPTVDADAALKAAKISERAGIRRFSLVTSGRTLSEADIEKLCAAFEKIGKECKLELCGSFGLISESDILRLKAAGMTRIHCNLETAPSKFAELCTTHTIDEKIATLKAARSAGLSICSGGIIGMGESLAQRVELAIALAEIDADSIPINILQPIKGTPLEKVAPISTDEILLAFALFRIINPRAHIRFAGGRMAIKSVQEIALKSGISGILTGDMLTTAGSSVAEDFAMLKRLGYEY